LELAREEALKLGHDFVGTEHVLLGLLPTAGEALAHTLQTNGEAVRAEIRRLISAFPGRPAICEPPLTPRARKALQLAGREARALKPSPIGTGHILLGLLLEGSGVAAIALGNLGVRLEQLRAEIPKD
jgi:ATP-dependent Clp protease ATP-binding subunit ClpC